MKMKKVDGARLREAIEKHGSLSKALAVMESQRQSLEAEIADLRGQQLTTVNEIMNLSVQITALQRDVQERKKVLGDLDRMVERDQRQYDLFEAFMAMVLTSPSRGGKCIGDLITSLQQIAEWGWFTAKSAEDLRNAFVRIVLGDYLHCFRCGKCGAKFIVNREPYDHGEYQCLTCRSSLWVEADDSFLEEMVSPGKPEEVSRAQELQKEVDRLKPLEVFLDIPCAICGKPMPNDKWVREDIVRIFKDAPKAHPACWKTPIGQLILFREYTKALRDVFGQSEGSKPSP